MASEQKLRSPVKKAHDPGAYRTLFDYAPDGIIIADSNSYYIDANTSMCRMLGYTHEELVGLHASDIVVLSEVQHINPALEAIKSHSEYHREWQFRRKDGSVFPAEVIATAMPDGNLMGMVRDITLQKQHESEIDRLSRLYAALSHINQAIVRMPSRGELFRKVCQILVEHGGFSMAWTSWHDPETHQLVPVADWGDKEGYIQSLKVYGDERPEGCGPSGRAFRSGQPFICNDILHDEAIKLWRDRGLRRSFRAMAAFPIRMREEVRGTITIYADEPAFFQDKEIALLEEAAADVSFALDNLAREEDKRRVEAIAVSEKAFSETMIESMPGILYFYNEQGQFLRWNRNMEDVTGYTGEEITRMHPLDFFAAGEKELIAQRIAEVLEKGASFVEANLLARDGSTTPYFFTGKRIVFDGVPCLVGMGIDISERRRAEEALAESQVKYRELVELANSIILRWNSEGQITFLNEFGQRFFGYAAGEIIGRNVMETIVPRTETSGRDLQQLMEQICADPKSFEQNTNENIRRNGERVWIAWTNRIVHDERGRVLEILSVGTDITERKQAEEAIRELNTGLERRVVERTGELQAALVRAEAADRIKSAFLATMSHELRTPLNSIIGFTGVVLQGLAGPLNEEQSKQLGMVRGSARHLLALINDVLDLSKIEAGQIQVRAELFDLRDAITRATGLVKPLADKKALALNTVVPPASGGMLSDRRRVEQILINLLNNAIKFTERGSVTLTMEQVTDYRPQPDATPVPAVRLRVADTGIGIKPEDLATLFQPFRQIDSGLARQHEGTGLGLAICRRLATLLGGEISAASEWSRGSEFTVTLPMEKPSGS